MKPSMIALVTLCLLGEAVFAGIPASASGESDFRGRQTSAHDSRPLPESLNEVALWLSAEFGLPISALPDLEFVAKERMGALRHRGVPSDHASIGRDILAVYDDDARTIYLPHGWTGETAVDTSILVHEMVHHAQNLMAIKAECPQAREKLAYEAQQRWLARFGTDLAREFGVDAFTLLVLTNCGF